MFHRIETDGPLSSTKTRYSKATKCHLIPINMDCKSLTWAEDSDIDVIMGGDKARLLVQDNKIMNRIMKPENLRFYDSPICRLPLAFGLLSGKWSTESTNTVPTNNSHIEQTGIRIKINLSQKHY